MNLEFAINLLKQLQHPLNEPGSSKTFVGHPHPSLRNRYAVPIGIVSEHRFAFCHWIKLKKDLLSTRQAADDASFVAPDLISFDWHDDSGTEDDYNEDQLRRLDQTDENEVSLFAWAGLRSLNDGHIRPAMWLNTVGNIYVVLKQGWDDSESRDELMKDRYGKDHHLFFFRTPRKMMRTFEEHYSGAGVIWDLDLDYPMQICGGRQ